MRINSVNISAFGGLKNKVISFEDGLNVIHGQNENGKTTVMSFIKMMFYGSGRASATLKKDLRKRYTPWDGAPMAGSIDFTLKGKNYRLEREFRKSDSTDKISLIDLDFGTREAVSSDIGVKLLGLSAAAFERSVFIGQIGIPEKDSEAEGEINSKLSNIVATGEESVSFETVNERLEAAETALMSKRKVGSYDKNMKRIAELSEELESAQKIYTDYNDFKVRAEKYREDMYETVKRVKQLKEKIDSEQDIRNSAKLREMLEIKAELDEINEVLKLNDGGFADEMYLKKLNFCAVKAQNAQKSLKNKLDECERLKNSIALATNKGTDVTPEKLAELKEEIIVIEEKREALAEKLNEAESRYNSLKSTEKEVDSSKKAVNLPLLIIGIVLLPAAAGAVALKSLEVAGAIGAVGIILIALSFILRPEDKAKKNSFLNELNNIKTEQTDIRLTLSGVISELSGKTVKYESANTALNTSAAMLEEQKKLLSDTENEAVAIENQLKSETDVLFELFTRYKTADSIEQITAEIEKIAELARKQKEIKQRLNYIAKDVGNISYEEAERKLKSAQNSEIPEDFDAIKKEYDELLTLLADKKEELARAEATAISKLEKARNPETVKREIAELKEKTAAEAEYHKALGVAAEALKESFAELRRGYGSALEKRAGEIFASLTGGRYEGMQISKAFDIAAEKVGVFGGKETAFLSNGTVDQAYLSLRLALSELIFEDGERLPILLDDALTQYDDERMETAVKYLSEVSDEGQTIMFTCHNSVYNTAEKTAAKLIKL